MEYKRSDMYVQAGRGKRNGRSGKAAPVKRSQVDLAAEVDLSAELALGVTVEKVEKVEEHFPVPPVLELPQEGECGYCVTPVMSYTPMQKWGKRYEPEQALERGTIFCELDYPFMGKGGKRA